MKKLVIICISLFPLFCFNQSDLKTLKDRALGFYYQEQLDSALFYYEKVLELVDSKESVYYHGVLGDLYLESNNLEKAKENYLQCIEYTSKERRSYSRNCFLGISDIYLYEKNYKKALENLKLVENNFSTFRICSNGGFEEKTELNYKFAQCYFGLNDVNKAISCLTPYMFSFAEGLIMDSTKYIEISNFYVKLLRSKYDNNELTKLLSTSIENMFYSKQEFTEMNAENSEDNWFNVICYFEFLGERVTLIDGGYESNSWGGEPVSVYTKKYLIELIYNTPTYINIVN